MLLRSFLLALVTLSAPSVGVSAPEWERGISLEQALKAADAAAGFPKGRPVDHDVITVKLTRSSNFDASQEFQSERLKDMESLSPPKWFWIIVYRRWPPRMENYLVVFIDANSGETIRVYRH